MQNLKYAFRFIKRSFQLAVDHEELQKPWMTLTLGSLALMLAAAVPLALVIGMIGLIPIGMIFIGLISTFLLFCLRIFGEITALSTSQICDKLIRVDGEGEAPEPFRVSFNRSGKDVLNYRLIYPILRLYYQIRGIFSKETVRVPSWLSSGGLVLPLLALDKLSLDEATQRVSDMAERNLLRLRSSFIPVDIAARFVEWVTMVAGIVLGFVVGIALVEPMLFGSWKMLLGGLVGLVIAGALTTVGIAFSTFTRACYHTSLYRWAENIAAAQKSGGAIQASPPKILGQVLGNDS